MRQVRAALAALCLWAGAAYGAPVFVVDDAGLSQAERTASARLLDAAAARLPPAVSAAFDHPVRVRWEDLPPDAHGRATRWRIALRRGLLAGSIAGDDRAALAAALHELAHLYDRSAQARVSHDPRFLDLAGWQRAVWRPGRRGRNDFRDRSPDAYELASPREFFAVNLEHYLLDAGYRCRRPDLAGYFDERFGAAPSEAAPCADGLTFVQSGSGAADPLLRLDPRRIFAIDYLLADGNTRPMSRFGHSMLRLVVCAPGRARGEACRGDVQHHLVLSFRAFVDDLQISGWRGLAGGYPSRLFVLPLAQVIDEYTKVELRGLHSIPLALSHEEIRAVARRAAQLHWSYDGRYRFVTSNCATETLKLLSEALPRIAALRLAAIAPNGLLRRLRRAGLTSEQGIPADADEAARLGYWFAPASAYFDELYEIARQSLRLAPADAAAWLALDPQRRRPVLERAWKPADLRAAAALLVLESAALRQQEALARDALKRRYLRRAAALDPQTAAQAGRVLALAGNFSRPAAWLDGVEGYGLPQAAELSMLERRAGADAQALREGGKDLREKMRGLLPPSRRAALETAERNLERIGERLRELAMQQSSPAS